MMWRAKGFLFWGFVISLSSFIKGSTLISEPKIHPVFIKSGSLFRLRCEQFDNYNIQWSRLPHFGLRDHDASPRRHVLTTESGFNQTLLEVDGRKVNILEKESVGFNDSGSYQCELLSGRGPPYAVDVYVVNTQGIDSVLTKIGEEARLQCRFVSEESVTVKFLWFRNDRELTSSTKYRINSTSGIDSSSVLHISKIGEADIGEYLCQAMLRNGLNFTHVVNLFSSPHVRPFERSRTVVEGADLVLECHVWGVPPPTVAWFNDTALLASNGDHRIEFFNFSVVFNSGLTVRKVAFHDRSNYTCVAKSSINGTSFVGSASIFIRVKGRLAPLYPLIGIFAEIIILLVIILLYERQRRRQRMRELSESADDLCPVYQDVSQCVLEAVLADTPLAASSWGNPSLSFRQT